MVQATATLTRFSGNTSSDTQMRVWASGPGRIKVEVDSDQGVSSIIVRDGGGKRVPAGKSPVLISHQSASTAHQWMFPWLILDSFLSSATLGKLQSGTIDGGTATGYQFTTQPAAKGAADLKTDLYGGSITLWLSGKGIPLRIDYLLPSNDNPYSGVPISRQYKDFQMTDGIMIPHTEEEYLGSVLMSRLKFVSISAPDSIGDAVFAIPATAGAR